MEWIHRRLLLILTLMVMGVTIIGTAIADPIGSGTLSPTSSSRGTDASAGSLIAQGGNVTNVDIVSSTVTGKWSGFYGNVTGSVTLEDGSGNNFYNWSDASPTGQIYATRNSATPTWASVSCINEANISTEATELSLATGMDNITNTFCEACGNHSAFTVGATSFTDDECIYRTNAYNASGSQTDNWDQVILHDGSFPIYTTIINQDANGFENSLYDFQLLVAENSSTSTLTTYFFYLEI